MPPAGGQQRPAWRRPCTDVNDLFGSGRHLDCCGDVEVSGPWVTIATTGAAARQQVLSELADGRRYLVVAPSIGSGLGKPVRIQRR